MLSDLQLHSWNFFLQKETHFLHIILCQSAASLTCQRKGTLCRIDYLMRYEEQSSKEVT